MILNQSIMTELSQIAGFCAFAEVDPFVSHLCSKNLIINTDFPLTASIARIQYYNSFRRSFVSLFILLTTAK